MQIALIGTVTNSGVFDLSGVQENWNFCTYGVDFDGQLNEKHPMGYR